MVGAEFLAAAGSGAGGLYFEVEVLEAKGHLRVGVAGTNVGPQCRGMGDDTCSWGCYFGDGEGVYGCAMWRCGDGAGPGGRGAKAVLETSVSYLLSYFRPSAESMTGGEGDGRGVLGGKA